MECRFLKNIIHYFIRLTVKHNIYSDTDKECTICMENNKEIMFYPCKHYYCCTYCSKLFDLCPICRKIILFKINLNNTKY
jgi:hypothetical protein